MTGNEHEKRPLLGRLTSVEGVGVVVMQDRFAADVPTVWTALTDTSELAHWLGDIDGDLRADGRYHVRFHASGAERDHRIDVCQAPTHVKITSVDEAGRDGVVIDVTLAPDGDGSVLRLTQTGLPLLWVAAFGAGMQVQFEDLARHLAGRGRTDSDARMAELVPLYQRQGVTALRAVPFAPATAPRPWQR
jgi:uncharacterized protein YndB with AHSA1/START domain